jgi:excisionase family DNA binding protein
VAISLLLWDLHVPIMHAAPPRSVPATKNPARIPESQIGTHSDHERTSTNLWDATEICRLLLQRGSPSVRACSMEIHSEDPYHQLVQALAVVVHQAVADALAEVLPQHLTPVISAPASVVDVAEAASRLCLSVSKTKKLIASRDLPSVQIGRRRLVPVSAVDDFISSLQPDQLRLPGMAAG